VNAPVYIGLISGTSRDGLDAALVSIDDGMPRLRHALCLPYPEALRSRLDALILHLVEAGRRPGPEETARLDEALGEFFAEAARKLLSEADQPAERVRAIGSHGQTVWHEPTGPAPLSMQLGNAEVLQRLTGIPVVSDFRTADVEAGGQGAPLAPLLHRALFHTGAPCTVLNLGGIANVTLLSDHGDVLGFDTGPANCLLDAWHQRHCGAPFDDRGAWGAGGTVLPGLLERLLDDDYFRQSPPKSTGLETFNLGWLERRLEGGEAPRDVQRTLVELTVRTVVDGLRQGGWFSLADRPGAEILVCGGGVHNPSLMDRLAQALSPTRVSSTAVRGIDPDWVEATLFAWLAHERLEGHRLKTGPITGARQPVMLGRITPAPSSSLSNRQRSGATP
jgi:anhydro-N-acetylmuramic acid kinase